jgi:hypothetical protein
MSDARKRAIENLKNVTELTVILVTKDNLNEYILPNHPLHESYQYLSETHKADYLRTYFMNFHGGGYSDIKVATGSWGKAYEELLESEEHWMIGYKELSHIDPTDELIGTGCFICKPNTPFTNEWYNCMIAVLEKKLEELREHPSTFPQDCIGSGSGSGYPFEWNEILAQVFIPINYKYKKHILRSLPICDLTWGYR